MRKSSFVALLQEDGSDYSPPFANAARLATESPRRARVTAMVANWLAAAHLSQNADQGDILYHVLRSPRMAGAGYRTIIIAYVGR